MATDTLNIIIKSKADGKGADEAKKGLGGIEKAAKFAAGAFAALKLAQGAVDFVAFGAGVQRQATALDNLAQSAGTSGSAVVAAIQNASDFTIDRMTAMSAASKALIMDVAKTPDEFERLTKVATALGRAMGQDAAKSIDDFVTAAARQSKQIADNLGLVVGAGAANEQYAKKLGKTADALTDAEKKQAFLNAMLTAGEEKLTALGDTSGGAATKIEKLKAAVNDAKAGLAEMAAETFDAAVDVDELAKRFRELPQTVSKMGQLANWAIEAGEALLHGKNAADAFQAAIRRDYLASEEFLQTVKAMPPAVDGWYVAMQGASGAVGDTTRSAEDLQFALRKVYGDLSLTKDEFNAAVDPAGELMYQSDELAASLARMADASAKNADFLKRMSERAVEAGEAALDMGMNWKTFFDRNREETEDFAQQREDLETEHQARLAEIQTRGQAQAIQVNAAAEEKKLADLRYRLDLALMQQSEFSDKTKESTRTAKEHQIAELQGQIASQEQLLDGYYNGRLMTQGENISGELAAEQARYAEELALIDAELAKQQEAQRAAMGQMVLQSFEAWATMKGIPADKMLEMRTAIAQEYGLIDQETANAVTYMTGQWESWSNNFDTSASDVIGRMSDVMTTTGEVKKYMDALPSSWDFKVNVAQVGTMPATSGATGGQITILQHGTPWFRGGMALVGERGPELAMLPRGAQVLNARQTARALGGNITNIFNINAAGMDARELADVINRHQRLGGMRRPTAVG